MACVRNLCVCVWRARTLDVKYTINYAIRGAVKFCARARQVNCMILLVRLLIQIDVAVEFSGGKKKKKFRQQTVCNVSRMFFAR